MTRTARALAWSVYDTTPPEEALLTLTELDADDAQLAALILCQRARAEMLLKELEDASKHLLDAEARAPKAFAVRMTSVNLRVHVGRVALRDDRAFSLAEVQAAMNDAVQLRSELVAMKRWKAFDS